MVIKTLELTNWGPIKHLKKDFDSNVVGIIGKNGKGKSSILHAIEFALTGALPERNETYIHRFGDPDGAKSATVKIVFSKNGQEGTITRTIAKSASKRSLEWNGETVTKATDVDNTLASVLGASKAAITNAVFPKQGATDLLIRGDKSEREGIYQKLLGLVYLNNRCLDIQGCINRLQAGIVDLQPALDAATAKVASSELRMTSYFTILQESKSYKEHIAYFKKLQVDIIELDKAQHLIKYNRGKIADHNNNLCTINAKYNYKSVDEFSADIRKAQEVIAAAKGNKELLQSVKSTSSNLEISKNALQDKKYTLTDLEGVLNKYPNIDDIQIKLNDLKLKQADSIKITQIRQTAKAVNENITNTKQRLDEATAELNTTLLSISAVPDMLEQIGSLTTEIANVKVRLEHSTMLTDASHCPICNSSMSPLSPSELEADEAKYHNLLQKQAEVQTAYNNINNNIRNAQASVSNLNSILAVQQQSLDSANYELSLIDPVSEEDMANIASGMIAQLEQTITEHNTTVFKVTQLRAEVDNLNKTIQSYEEFLKQHASANVAAMGDLDKCIEENTAILARQDDLSIIMAVTKSVQDLEDSIVKLTETESNLQSKLNDLEDWYTYAPEDLAEDPVSLDLVNIIIGRYEELQEEYNKNLADYNAASVSLEEDKEGRDKIQASVDANKERVELSNNLTKARSLLSKTGLPIAYMDHVFACMTSLVQNYLEKMQANFTVTPDKERPVSFLFSRLDDSTGYAMPQEKLSGGQSIRLALAVLLACQQLLLPDVGFLVLDEPSSHIDTEGVDSLKDLFQSLGSLLSNSDTQLVVVDHNESLITGFSKVVEL